MAYTPKEMIQLSVNRSRDYYPHHTLLSAAYMNLELAETEESGSHYTQMAAILFSGLAIEALANSFGERYVKNWDDYETSRPIAKIQIVCEVMGAGFDEEKQPWCHLRWLIRFRNRLVHAKPEMVRIEKEMSRDEWNRERMSVPNSKLEKEISLANAKRAVDAAHLIRDLLCEQISEDDLNNLRADGWSSNASVIPPKG